MTSPALWSTTWSPMRMSLRRTSSRLWSVARATVEPATLTGRRWATGVSVPGPADVGHDVLDHGLDLLRRELVGDGPARRPADHAQAALLVEPVDLDHDAVGLVGQVVARLLPALRERDARPRCRGPRCRSGCDREAEAAPGGRARPTGAPTTGDRRGHPRAGCRTRPTSRRLAVTGGSIWRSEPAPLLRGLAYSASPASSRSALMRANSALGM